MAEKIITFKTQTGETNLRLGRSISREDLYGKLQITKEKDGPLERVLVTQSGDIFPAKCRKTLRCDTEGSVVSKPVPKLESGENAPLHKASSSEARELVPCEAKSLVGFRAKDMMAAETDLPAGFYKTNYIFRDGTDLLDAYLIVRENGDAFFLTGDQTNIPLRGKNDAYEFFDGDDEEEDGEEDSFSMW